MLCTSITNTVLQVILLIRLLLVSFHMILPMIARMFLAVLHNNVKSQTFHMEVSLKSKKYASDSVCYGLNCASPCPPK